MSTAGWSLAEQAYRDAAWLFDEHQATCGACAAGARCGAGDDLAEAESRGFDAFATAAPEMAGHPGRHRPGIDPLTSERWETSQ